MIRAVLFDAAGTLIHLREAVGETYARVARAHGAAADAARLQAAFPSAFRAMPPMVCAGVDRATIRAGERDWWRRLVDAVFAAGGTTWPSDGRDACFDELFAHYGSMAAWRCADGARETLQALRVRGLRTGMVSNFDHRLPPLLEALGLAPLLDTVVLPADAGAAKPDPRIFNCALARLAIEAAAAAYVGDDPREDVAGARDAGLRAIDVTTLPNLAALEAVIA